MDDSHNKKRVMDENQKVIPPGYHFYPTDEQLVALYLWPLVTGQLSLLPCPDVIIQRNLYGPKADIALIFDEESRKSKYYNEEIDILYFYTPLTKKYGNGSSRIDRVAGARSWKGQDGDRDIYDKDGRVVIGKKKNYAFNLNEQAGSSSTAKRKKSDVSWIMCEYSLVPTAAASSSSSTKQDNNDKVEHVLCRIRRKRAKDSSSSYSVDEEEVPVQRRRAAADERGKQKMYEV